MLARNFQYPPSYPESIIIAHRLFLEQANTKKSTFPSIISCVKVGQLADPIQAAAKHKSRSVEIQHIADPRVEAEVHHYDACQDQAYQPGAQAALAVGGVDRFDLLEGLES